MKTALALILLASPAFPDELPYLDDGTTRFGTLTIADTDTADGPAQSLLLNDKPIEGLTDRFLGLRAVLPRPDGADADWALVSMANGGNACPMMWAFIEVTAKGAQATLPFGSCSENVQNPRTVGASVALDMESLDPAVAYYTYFFHGQLLTTTAIPQTNDGATVAGAGDDVTRWIGQHPASPFDDAGERLRFMQIMVEDQVYELASRVEVADVVVEVDGWVIGQGFFPASGGDMAGMWGIRIADGTPFAVFQDTGLAPLATYWASNTSPPMRSAPSSIWPIAMSTSTAAPSNNPMCWLASPRSTCSSNPPPAPRPVSSLPANASVPMS
jgi:hypothetical protein